MAEIEVQRHRRHTRVLASLAVGALAFMALTGWSLDQNRAGDLINNYRKVNRLTVLRGDALAMKKAQAWSERMAQTGRLEHTGGGKKVNTSGVRFGTVYCGYKENVGFGASIEAVHLLFRGSPVHRGNMLSRSHRVGVGVTRKGNTVWVTEIYLRLC